MNIKNSFDTDLKESLKDYKYLIKYLKEAFKQYFEHKNINVLLHCLRAIFFKK